MKNGSPLENKAAQVTDKLIETTEGKLITEYGKALKSIKSDLQELYEKYANGAGELTYAEMAKYNRLKQLYDVIYAELTDLGKKVKNNITTLAGDAYEESYYRYGFALENDYGVAINYGLLNPATIRASVEFPQYGLPVSETLKRNNYELFLKCRQKVTQGFIKGDSYQTIARAIEKVMGEGASRALMVARTEGTRNATQGQLDSYDYAAEKGIEIDIVWMATLDGRTRPSHIALHGKTRGPDKLFHAEGDAGAGPGQFTTPAMNINCRCRLVSEFSDDKEFSGRLQEDYATWKKNLEKE